MPIPKHVCLVTTNGNFSVHISELDRLNTMFDEGKKGSIEIAGPEGNTLRLRFEDVRAIIEVTEDSLEFDRTVERFQDREL